MNAIRRAIARGRRRLLIHAALRVTGWCLFGALMAMLGLVLADHVLSLPSPWWLYAALPAAAVVIAPVLAMLRRPDHDDVAALIDERLGLKDRLGTALYASRLNGDPFAHHVLAEAEAAATGARVAAAIPVRLTRIWGYVPVMGAVLAVAAVFMADVQLDLFGISARQLQQLAEQADAEEAEQHIVQASTLIRALDAERSEPDAADPADVMQELAALTNRDLSNPEMRRETLARLSDVREKLEEKTQAQEEQFRELSNSMSRVDPERPGPADRFADALRRGDFREAKRQLEQISEQVDQMSDADKQAMQEQLENIEEQLDEMAEQSEQRQQEAEQQTQDTLREAGLDQQQIDQLQQQGNDPQQVQEALEQQGASESQAQQTAQQVQQQQQSAQSAQQQQNNQQGLSDALGQMAQSLQQEGKTLDEEQGGPGQGGAQFQEGSFSGQQQLDQMAKQQQQLQQMRGAQQQLSNAMQSLNGQQGQGQGQGQGGEGGDESEMSEAEAIAQGRQAGTGDGGNPYGPERSIEGYQATPEGDIREGRGRVITSWIEDGPTRVGEPTVEFDQAVTAAQDDAERAVTEDRVPRRYHGTVKDYFDQLPQSAEDARRAPKAPR